MSPQPDNSFRDRVEEILNKLESAAMVAEHESESSIQVTGYLARNHEEAITAIEAAVLELIGKDEDERFRMPLDDKLEIRKARNQLRVQLREGLHKANSPDAEETKS